VEPGSVLAGRYRLARRLGTGGQGEVWRGWDAQDGRDVAVKVMLGRDSDPATVTRFRREATLQTSLGHPGITVVHDVGSHDGRMFIVMELLQGNELSALIDTSPGGLGVEQAVEFAIQVADVLAVTHAKDIVHRDLKPANIFVQHGDRLKVCDFGLAREMNATRVTLTGQILGTPLYMAPEQWEGVKSAAAADLYALGCIMYEMLTGAPPFTGVGLPALMRQHLLESPVPPIDRNPGVPPRLSGLVLALLAKDAAGRPDGASAVLGELTQIRDRLRPPEKEIAPAGPPLAYGVDRAPPPPPGRREARSRRRRRRGTPSVDGPSGRRDADAADPLAGTPPAYIVDTPSSAPGFLWYSRPVACAALGSKRFDVIVVSGTLDVQARKRDGLGAWSVWERVGSMLPPGPTALAAGYDSKGALAVATVRGGVPYLDSRETPALRLGDAGHTPRMMDIAIASATPSESKLHVFALDESGGIWGQSGAWNDSWRIWERIPGSTSTRITAIAACSTADHGPVLVALADRRLYVIRRERSSFGWQRLDLGHPVVDVTCSSAGSYLEVYARDTNQRVLHAWALLEKAPLSWSEAVPVPGEPGHLTNIGATSESATQGTLVGATEHGGLHYQVRTLDPHGEPTWGLWTGLSAPG
jgi:serine/threonine protein kinase